MKSRPTPKHKNPNFESKDESENYGQIWVSLLQSKGTNIKYHMYTTEYLAFGKDLLAKLYLTGKVYIPKLLGVCIIHNKSHGLNEVILFGYLHFWGFLWPWKLTFIEHWIHFNSPTFFPRWLTVAVFLLDASLFSLQLIKRKRNKNQLIKSFSRMLLRKKVCLYVKFINTVDSRWFEYLKTLPPLNHSIFTNYLQRKTNFWAKLTKNHIQ